MKTMHTPGPWILDELRVMEITTKGGPAFESKAGYLRTSDNIPFCSFLACKPFGGWMDNYEELEANAAKIRAALG